ncbi:hypothetical protein [Faecalibacterium sp. AM43-5AT]|jgi:hypothetical protein|uniref:hypothetical protein n=1 Tax=Faecalibacterium sp. AM43-5AT TaxID=2302957 RepID=UPI000E7376E9|nr:hypothetical protein [Faecalibacterium sp. AM43-5AT]RJV96934.1 hypothetical protein DW937_05435 [Faecalibacterium sp. AM43-5AT]
MNNHHVEDDGFAVWVVPIDKRDGSCDVDLHINQWIMPSRKTSSVKVFSDFGIRVSHAHNISNICFFVPFDMKESYTDLSKKLKNPDISRGIFNTNCTINANDGKNIFELSYNSHQSNVLEMIPRMKGVNNGVLVTFDLKSIIDSLTKDEVYVRFRIKNSKLGVFLEKESKMIESFATLLSSPIIKEGYSYTIRVNEMRCLPDEIRRDIFLQEQKVKKIILTVCMNGQLLIDNNTCYKTRTLEKALYKDYIPSNFISENCMVYQWLQEKPNGSHYNLTTTFYKEYINKKSFLIYAIFVVLFSALGGGVVEIIKLIISHTLKSFL